MPAINTGEINLTIYQASRDTLSEPNPITLIESSPELLLEQREALIAIKEAQEEVAEAARKLIAPPLTRDRPASTTQAKTIDEFYVLLQKVLEAAVIIDGTDYLIRMTKEWPPIDAALPCFSIKLLGREPWSNRGRRELAPRLIEELPDPQFPGDVLQIYQRRQLNEIQITCWARTSKTADKLANWLEDKFYEYMWVLQWAGTSQPITWLGRDEDIYREERRQQMYGAPIRFQVVTAKLTYKRATILRRIARTLGITTAP